MRTIYKFPFAVDDVVTIEIPGLAKLLHIECQSGVPCLWAVVESTGKPEVVQFAIVGTGNPFPANVSAHNHFTTFQHGPFVWHVFLLPPATTGEGVV